MRSRTPWESKDSSNLGIKVALRRAYLPKKAKVLDLFCGAGDIYNRVYKGRVLDYLGIDHLKIHDHRLCYLSKNTVFVAHNDISRFNVFDLDDYGSPWLLLYMILRKQIPARIHVFMTDGIILHRKLHGKVTKNISATERIPRNMVIPGINRWYIDIFSTMLLDVQHRTDYLVQTAKYIFNDRESVCYWYVSFNKKVGNRD